MMNILYYEAFERFVAKLTDISAIPSTIDEAVRELCSILRIERLEVTQFPNYLSERADEGKTLYLYQTDKAYGQEPVTMRVENENRSINRSAAFPEAEGIPWTEEERNRILLFTKTLHNFISRTQLLQLANYFAFYDDAGYPNLRFFHRTAWEYSEKDKLDKMNAFHFNLKHFALINQQIGRLSGNAVMRRFFDGLQEMLGNTGYACRVGGDNFVILAEKKDTDAILNYLSGTGIVYDEKTSEKILISACVGVFEIPEGFHLDGESDLMDKVHSCTMAAKSSNTTDVVFFSEEMVAHKRHIMQIQQLFPQAIAAEEFLVYYQPKVDISTKELNGAEALCRWQHDGRLIPPMEFIPILEAGMEVCTLDFYMLDKVCKDIRRWMKEGRRIVRISVNLSRRHMADMNLLEHILEIVDGNQVPHEYIEIELTETTTDVEFIDLKRVVGGLQEAGISTSVDDFGIGYSSLNLIREIPWNVLKVDKSFLPDNEETSDSRRTIMFRHVISMAREIGLECITEGVETAAQVKLLHESRCETAQGFYFDKPLPVAEFEKRLNYPIYQK